VRGDESLAGKINTPSTNKALQPYSILRFYEGHESAEVNFTVVYSVLNLGGKTEIQGSSFDGRDKEGFALWLSDF